MILVFGGTTEGKRVCTALSNTAYSFWYSSKTPIEVELPPNAQYRYGAFTPALLKDFCIEQQVKLIIHASHPFAAILHQTIGEVSQQLNIPVLRIEREYQPPSIHPLCRYVNSYEEALAQLAAGEYEPVLSLTGVQTIARLQPYWQTRKLFCRILPRESSVAIAQAAGFPEQNLLLSFPGTTVEAELEVIRATGVQAILTKESGESGFLSVKIAAAIEAGIPIYIIARPALPDHFILVNNETTIQETIKQLYA